MSAYRQHTSRYIEWYLCAIGTVCPDVCWRMLTYADVCWRKLTCNALPDCQLSMHIGVWKVGWVLWVGSIYAVCRGKVLRWILVSEYKLRMLVCPQMSLESIWLPKWSCEVLRCYLSLLVCKMSANTDAAVGDSRNAICGFFTSLMSSRALYIASSSVCVLRCHPRLSMLCGHMLCQAMDDLWHFFPAICVIVSWQVLYVSIYAISLCRRWETWVVRQEMLHILRLCHVS